MNRGDLGAFFGIQVRPGQLQGRRQKMLLLLQIGYISAAGAKSAWPSRSGAACKMLHRICSLYMCLFGANLLAFAVLADVASGDASTARDHAVAPQLLQTAAAGTGQQQGGARGLGTHTPMASLTHSLATLGLGAGGETIRLGIDGHDGLQGWHEHANSRWAASPTDAEQEARKDEWRHVQLI